MQVYAPIRYHHVTHLLHRQRTSHIHYSDVIRSLTVGGGKSEWKKRHLQPTVRAKSENMYAYA